MRKLLGAFSLFFAISLSFHSTLANETGALHYLINSTNPKYSIALMIYDETGAAWPNYCMGKPDDGGWFTTRDKEHPQEKSAVPTAPFDGRFRVHFTKTAQNQGDQSRRILGETMEDGETDVIVELLSLGETRDITIDHNDDFSPLRKSKRSPDGTKEVQRTKAKLKLTVRGTSTEIDAEIRIKRSGKTSHYLDSFFSVEGSDIGLKKVPGRLNMRLYLQARLPKE